MSLDRDAVSAILRDRQWLELPPQERETAFLNLLEHCIRRPDTILAIGGYALIRTKETR